MHSIVWCCFCKLCCVLHVCLLTLSNAKERCRKLKHDQPTLQCTSVDVILYKQRTQRQRQHQHQHLTTINDLHFNFRSLTLPLSHPITVCVFIKHFSPPQITDGGINSDDHSLLPCNLRLFFIGNKLRKMREKDRHTLIFTRCQPIYDFPQAEKNCMRSLPYPHGHFLFPFHRHTNEKEHIYISGV